MELTTIALWIVSIPIIYFVYYVITLPRKLPPGPIGLPLVGYNPNPFQSHRIFTENAEKYGRVWSYYRLGTLVVVLNDAESIKDVYVRQGEKVMDRPPMQKPAEQNRGVLFNSGLQWHIHRRFSLSTLRNLGFGKPILENGINYEVDNLVQAVREKKGQNFDIQYLLNNAVSNVICQLIVGRRFEYSDTGFWDILNLINILATGIHPVGLIGIPLWFIELAVKFGGNKMQTNRMLQEKVHDFMLKMVTDHKNEYNIKEEPNDYIQAFVKEQSKGTKTFDDLQLLVATSNMFAAGAETTSNTIRWGILYCILNPSIQDKIYQEIVEGCGKNSFPSLKDRSALPYTEAVLLETQRMGNSVPAVYRYATEDLSYKEFNIPKGTIVVANQYAVNMDPRTFSNPECFQPERFIDSETGKINKTMADHILPFGAGKRVCLGEGLAKMELFLLFAALMQQFRFRIPPGQPPPSTEPNTGIVSQPKPFQILVETRE